jgi:hypothetical protein
MTNELNRRAGATDRSIWFQDIRLDEIVEAVDLIAADDLPGQALTAFAAATRAVPPAASRRLRAQRARLFFRSALCGLRMAGDERAPRLRLDKLRDDVDRVAEDDLRADALAAFAAAIGAPAASRVRLLFRWAFCCQRMAYTHAPAIDHRTFA